MSGRHFRDYHLLLDEHGDQIFAMTDALGIGLRSVAESPSAHRYKQSQK
jgi:starvation-inducible DNA-binding protein